jgi:hypothetical protein
MNNRSKLTSRTARRSLVNNHSQAVSRALTANHSRALSGSR